MDGGLKADLELLTLAAREAGALAMRYFRQNPSAWAKAGGSPVTEADMAVDRLLHERLLAARPTYGWLSEETVDDPVRCERDSIFVVDPIDGTRGFIEGDDRWCVSLAVVCHGRPIVAALFAPARDELMTVALGGGARMRKGDDAVADGRLLSVGSQTELSGARLAGPRGWLKSPILRRTGTVVEPHVPSLAYRIASVATGAFDAAFASPGSHDWDLAACDLLVHEAGGRLTGLDGSAPGYNREIPRHGVLAAANRRLHPAIVATLNAVALERASAGLPV